MSDRPPSRIPSSRRGFALLITITLLAFLVLLLVSLASLTRVETQVAGNSQSLAQARQNALMALNVAIGELQRTAGPDQRVTATADLVAGTDPSKIRWTGVWDATNPTSVPTWLVSRANPTVAPVNTGAVPAPDADNIELVGTRSADFSIVPGNRIVVPAQAISADVPGVGTNLTVGKYAWWVGDEGVKARVNLRDPWAASTASTTRLQSWQMAQRLGAENLRTTSATASTRLGTDFPTNQADLEKLFQHNQIPLLNTSSANLGTLPRNLYHEVTLHSRGVLADTVRGGLRKDLTAWVNNPSPVTGAPANDDLIFTPADMGVTGTVPASDSFGLPTWGLIRDFNTVRADGNPVPPRRATDTTQGLHPVVTYFRVGFALSGEQGQPLRVHVFPVAVLWNPHSVALASADYEIGMFHRTPAAGVSLRRGTSSVAATEFGVVPFNQDGLANGPMWSFRVTSGVIPAGQSFVYALPETVPAAEYSRIDNLVQSDSFDFANSVVYSVGEALPASMFSGDPATRERIFWQARDGWTGQGEVDMAMRFVGDSGIEPFSGTDLRASALISAQRTAGQGWGSVTGTVDLTAIGPLGPTVPIFAIGYEYKMGSTNYVNPRWIATGNARAQFLLRTASNPDNPTYIARVGTNGVIINPVFPGDRASAGLRVRGDATPVDMVLSEILPAGAPLLSLAQLQHANLARISSYPAHAVGNSHPNHRMDGEQITRQLPANAASMTNLISRVYDFSYGLNRALWDRYFFSSIDSTFSQTEADDPAFRLANSRLRFHRTSSNPDAAALTASTGFNEAASSLVLEGAFNVNSTSVEAWRALLTAANGLAYDPQNRSTGAALQNPISRFSVPLGGANNAPWSGYRTLTDAQIDQLARNIVTQVRERGPFRSLSDFINRRPLASSDSNYAHAIKGTLQAALDATTTGATAVNRGDVAPFNAGQTPSTVQSDYTFPGALNTPDNRYRLDLIRGRPDTTNVSPYSLIIAFAPGMISQADILNAIGPVISARSDTFVIRTYGESINPVTGESQGRAYCEAIVQRLPDYVDAAANADPATVATADNITFGRRFSVVGFRWINPDDI